MFFACHHIQAITLPAAFYERWRVIHTGGFADFLLFRTAKEVLVIFSSVGFKIEKNDCKINITDINPNRPRSIVWYSLSFYFYANRMTSRKRLQWSCANGTAAREPLYNNYYIQYCTCSNKRKSCW
jgi:hypothetical protein